MNSELILDLISKNVLLEEINSRKKQTLESASKRNSESDSLEQKTIAKHTPKYPKKYFVILSALAVLPLSVFSHVGDLTANSDQSTPLQTQYLIQNLQGDTTETWVSWNLTPNKVLTFTIIGESLVSDEQINAIKDVILSEKSLQIDNSLLHKGIKGTSTYYTGWKGAMDQVSKNPTKMIVPNKFEYVSSDNGIADITIRLVSQRNGDGYSGYTNSVVDNNQILKSTITVHDIEKLSTGQITTIIRHEFGHAIGLAHTTATEELMAPTITTDYPYISPCTIDAIEKLYNGNQKSEVVCEI